MMVLTVRHDGGEPIAIHRGSYKLLVLQGNTVLTDTALRNTKSEINSTSLPTVGVCIWLPA